MDSDSQVGCLGNFFRSRIRPPRPKSSSQSSNSQATVTSIAKGRSEVVASKSQVDSDQQKEGILYDLSPHSYSPPIEWWTSARPPSYSAAKEPFSAPDDDVAATVERTLDGLNPKLRDLSLKIHGIFSRRIMYTYNELFTINLGHPELQFQERFIMPFLISTHKQCG